jgi:hypothetical protein
MKLLHGVRYHDENFVMKKDTLGVCGFSVIQKCTAPMIMKAYGAPGNTIDDYLCKAKSTAIESMYWYCKAMVTVFGPNI